MKELVKLLELFDDEPFFKHSPHFYTTSGNYKIVKMSDEEVKQEELQQKQRYYKRAIAEREHTIKLAEQELHELKKKLEE